MIGAVFGAGIAHVTENMVRLLGTLNLHEWKTIERYTLLTPFCLEKIQKIILHIYWTHACNRS